MEVALRYTLFTLFIREQDQKGGMESPHKDSLA